MPLPGEGSPHPPSEGRPGRKTSPGSRWPRQLPRLVAGGRDMPPGREHAPPRDNIWPLHVLPRLLVNLVV